MSLQLALSRSTAKRYLSRVRWTSRERWSRSRNIASFRRTLFWPDKQGTKARIKELMHDVVDQMLDGSNFIGQLGEEINGEHEAWRQEQRQKLVDMGGDPSALDTLAAASAAGRLGPLPPSVLAAHGRGFAPSAGRAASAVACCGRSSAGSARRRLRRGRATRWA